MMERENRSDAIAAGKEKGETIVNGSTTPSLSSQVQSFDFLAPCSGKRLHGMAGSLPSREAVGLGRHGIGFPGGRFAFASPRRSQGRAAGDGQGRGIAAYASSAKPATAAVKSDHIVTIYQVGQANNLPYLAMELLEGVSLDDWLMGNQPDVATVVSLGKEIALGLAAAHESGLIHRDIKPGNVFLEARTRRAKILDFGLARPVHEASGLTAAGLILGTPDYMAPEQADGGDVSERSDLFSLGCLLYRLLAGEKPFTGATTLAVLKAVALQAPRPLAK